MESSVVSFEPSIQASIFVLKSSSRSSCGPHCSTSSATRAALLEVMAVVAVLIVGRLIAARRKRRATRRVPPPMPPPPPPPPRRATRSTRSSTGSKTTCSWAKGDSTLPCDSLYGCYWEPLSKCDGTWWWHESERKLPPKKHQKKPLYDTLTAQLRAYHHRHGPLLLRAAVFAWTYRPAKALAARINAVVEPIFSATSNGDLKVSEGGAGNCVAVHLRRGDQCHDKNKVCPPITAFIDAALDFADRYGLTSLFLATDDEDVIKAVVAKASELTVTFNKAIDRSGYAVSKKEGDDPNAKSGKPAYFVEERVARGELSPTPILDILVDVEAASRCSAFVGDGQSHVGEMILLKMAWNLGYVPPFYSVVGTFGTPWSAVENLESVGDFSTFWPMKTFEKNVGGVEKC